MPRAILALLSILVLACLAACGERSEPESDPPKAPPAPAPATMEAQPQADAPQPFPWTWGVELVVDAPQRVAGEGLPTQEDRDQLLGKIVEIIERRLDAAQVGVYRMVIPPASTLQIVFAEALRDRREEIVRLVTRLGQLEFLIEVLPDATYVERLDPGDVPGRRGLWKGSVEAFEAFKRAEVERFRAAQDAGKPYRCSRPAYRLVLAHDKDGSASEHYHVLEVPAEAKRFDGRMVRDPVVTEDQRGRPVVVFDIGAAWQDRFADWTERNRLLPMAILLDGRFHAAPTIRDRLTSNVQISLGGGRIEAVRSEAEALAIVLQTGALPVAPRLLRIAER